MFEKKRMPWNKKNLPQENICNEYLKGDNIHKLAERYNCKSPTPILRILKSKTYLSQNKWKQNKILNG